MNKSNNAKCFIRQLLLNDAEEYLKLRLQALREDPPAFGSLPEDEDDLKLIRNKINNNENNKYYGAFTGNQLSGIIRFSLNTGKNELHRSYVGGLYVDPKFRGRGYGKKLIQHAIKMASKNKKIRRVYLSVVTNQKTAIVLYLSLGFRIYGTEEETFSKNGVFYDEYLMSLKMHGDDE
ncbi:MAG: GNAT family N-acetyltransferase [Chitinivibrionales bacterium]|nr:GNAT family N-acetyltransferase [Chitinivibrionales bacterium]